MRGRELRAPPHDSETSRDYYSFNHIAPKSSENNQIPPHPYEPRNHLFNKENGNPAYDPANNRSFPTSNQPRNYETQQNESKNKEKKKYKPSPFDTFGESAIERIYSEFRFLDECSPSTSSQPIFKATSGKKNVRRGCVSFTSRMLVLAVLPVLQLVSAIGLLGFAFIRTFELFQEKGLSNLLLDLNKPEDYAVTTEEGAKIIRFRTGTAIIVPALLQCISALLGFWGFSQQRKKGMQIGHIVLTLLSIDLWMSALTNAAIELNINFIQLNRLYESTEYFIYVAIACLTYAQVLYLPTITMSFAAVQAFPMKQCREGPSLGAVLVALLTAVLAAISVSLSAYAASRSLSNIEDWPESPVVNPGALFAFGLNEAVVGAYVVSASWCTLLCVSVHSPRLFPVALLLTFTSLLTILTHVLTPSRLLSLAHAVQVLAEIPKPFPVSHICICLLYGSEIALCGSLVLLLVVTSIRFIDQSESASSTSPNSTNCSQL
ncbi:unnamed protein product, partial [Mesorhabditis belari]|uniref:Uncharacterized protein n=1 Tax=Mesorhabditis belari TaxID=2138241 RepID=A0AAF3E843_9BILA